MPPAVGAATASITAAAESGSPVISNQSSTCRSLMGDRSHPPLTIACGYHGPISLRSLVVQRLYRKTSSSVCTQTIGKTINDRKAGKAQECKQTPRPPVPAIYGTVAQVEQENQCSHAKIECDS